MHHILIPVLVLMSAGQCLGQQLAFELPLTDGSTFTLQPDPSKLTVVCFLGTECPMARVYSGRLSELQAQYGPRGVTIVGVMSNRQDSPEDVRNYIDSTNATFPIVVDKANVVADRYGATRTPEVYLLDGRLKLRYHGRIDDQYAPSVARKEAEREDLRAAIDELLAGKPVTVKETRALGCIIGKVKSPDTASVESNAITFSKDVFPILQAHCIECHRAGEIGPFAMNRYDEVVGWADTMMESIDDGRMPPWHADPQYGDFANERGMPDRDKEVLRQWIAGGSKQGAESDMPAEKEYVSGWQLEREPDAIYPMRTRPFSVPADGVVEYQYFVVDTGFTEDKWVKAAQVLPGSRDVVHHAIVFVRPPDGAQFQGIGWLTAYVPGQRALPLPEGHARFVPAGSKLVFQMHYTPNGTPREDITRVGLLFEDANSVDHSVFTMMALEQDFEIPPHAAAYEVEAALPWIPIDGQLLAITPHMHFRGKSFRLESVPSADVADREHKTLLSVPRYDFNWQHTYQLESGVAMNDLESLRFTATFDNSDANPFNPNPAERVTWGDQTWEEMAVAFFEVAVPRDPNGILARRSAGANLEEVPESNRDEQIEEYVNRVFEKMDVNSDGMIRKKEASLVVRRWNFWRWDLDRDDIATRAEVREVAESLFP